MTDQKNIAFTSGELFPAAEEEPLPPLPPQPVSCLPGKHYVPDGPFRQLMDSNFIQYASYVIRDRAIPDVNDGLKPVQRRILFSLHENDDGKFIKVANIVGYCMQFHPHGDASIADALVTLANKRYLIEGQGNYGNIMTGDPAAASRYIECRLTDMARNEVFNDKLTRFVPTYDSRKKEPVTLPAKLPLLLMLGAEGIAVGLSTRILPHNFCELIEAQIAILQKKTFSLLPDFQQGGRMDASDYNDGEGRVKIRAVIEIKDEKTLVITEIPFGTTTSTLISSIEDAARKKKIRIRSINDYTAEHVEIEIKLTNDTENTSKVVESLYAFTHCEISANSHAVFIRNSQPVEWSISEILRYTTTQLVRTLKRELLLRKRELLEELHRKTLVQIFIENRIYKKIEECKTYDKVQQAVLDGVNVFRDRLRRDVTLQDVEMLLGVKIRRISLFDINKNKEETDKILDELAKIARNLARLNGYAIRYLRSLLKKYGADYPRKTKVEAFKVIEVKKLTEKQLSIKLDKEKGYIGFDISGDPYFDCSSHDRMVIFWNDGTYRVYHPPEKLFVDEHLLKAEVYDRNRVYTVVYKEQHVTYLKRFKLGGVVLNRDYLCIPEGASLLFFDASNQPELYVKYKKEKRQRIHQQVFHPAQITVKGVKSKGIQMTVKKIRSISIKKPRNWDRGSTPPGAVMDFLQ